MSTAVIMSGIAVTLVSVLGVAVVAVDASQPTSSMRRSSSGHSRLAFCVSLFIYICSAHDECCGECMPRAASRCL